MIIVLYIPNFTISNDYETVVEIYHQTVFEVNLTVIVVVLMYALKKIKSILKDLP